MNKMVSKKFAIALLAMLATLGCSTVSYAPVNSLTTNPALSKGSSFTTFKIKRTEPLTKRIIAGLKADLSKTDIATMEKSYGVKFIKQVAKLKVAVFDSLKKDPSQIITNMTTNTKFDYVEQDEQVVMDDKPGFLETQNQKDITLYASSTDPLMKNQWHLTKIKAKEAWKTTEGQGITVAVVDTGVDLNHPDLKDNLVPGYNAINPSEPIVDDVNHGTHVAGLIAAVKGNKIGVAGVAPKAKIMPIKVLGEGTGGGVEVAEGIIWAVDHKANVINLSIRFRPTWDKYAETNRTIKKAIIYAFRNNIPIVCAMGNENIQENSTPAYLGNKMGYKSLLIPVGATTKDDARSDFSNFGPWISICAPGSEVLSTIATIDGAVPSYGLMDGTSMATPIVTGVVALMLSKKMDPATIKAKLEHSVTDLGDKGFDNNFGYGIIDASLAVK